MEYNGDYTKEFDASYVLACLFYMRTQTHYWHFQTRVEAEHSTLDEFYTKILKYADKFGEVVQGYDMDIMYKSHEEDAMRDYTGCANMIVFFGNNRVKFKEQINLCENKKDIKLLLIKIVELISQTIYKLKLK